MKEKCDHPISARKNESSYQMPKCNLVFVSCTKCGMKRHESRNNDGSINTGRWFVDKSDKTND